MSDHLDWAPEHGAHTRPHRAIILEEVLKDHLWVEVGGHDHSELTRAPPVIDGPDELARLVSIPIRPLSARATDATELVKAEEVNVVQDVSRRVNRVGAISAPP